MAKIVLISLYDRLTIGLGYLSSFLKSHGHATFTIGFKKYEPIKRKRLKDYRKEDHHVMMLNSGSEFILSYAAPPQQVEIDLLRKLVKKIEPDLVGISFRTISNQTVYSITNDFHNTLNIPVVWGGISPTLEPEKSIQKNDIVCVGEGEHPLLDLANAISAKSDIAEIKNLWVKKNGAVIQNPLRPLIQDLDGLPFPDYSPHSNFFVDRHGIQEGISISHFNGVYEIITSRGCPFSCTYCYNSLLRKMTSKKKEKYLRRRSVTNVIQELVIAKEKYPIKYVNFQDDVFTQNRDWVREFSSEYGKHVKLPFWCYHHPNFTDEESLKRLNACGLEMLTMGVQSGSEYILKEIYKRRTSREKILNTTRLLNKLNIKFNMDLITNNPFEREEDCDETLNLLLQIPRPLRFNGGLSELSVYPGTTIEKMKRNQNVDSYLSDKDFLFFNLLYLLCQTRLPRNLIVRFRKSRFIRKHAHVLKVFLVVPWLKMDFLLLLRNNMPAPIKRILKAIRNLRGGRHI